MDKLEVISIHKELLGRRITIFSIRDFMGIFRVEYKTARAFLSYHSAKGRFERLKRGAYIIPTNPPTKFEIANYLLKPSYISFETALSYYGIIPETVYTITSATTKSPKEYEFQKQNYQFHQIKKSLFFGYEPLLIRNRIVMIAEKEKALLDYLYLLSLKKRPVSERLDLSKINKKRLGQLINYFKKYIRKNKTLISLVKEVTI